MDGGQSISFTSFDSYNYPSHHNLTFHENEPQSSRHELAKDSTIRHFPGKQVNLGQNLEIMVLLQTAEIERLTINLHEYRMKFKRILNNERDYNSFKNQADELLQVKDQLELRNKKIYQFAENQKGELVDQFKYVKVLENKYKRALKLIEEAHMARQQLELSNSQLKEEIMTMEKTFESFKQKSIEEYQRLRDELQKTKNQQLSFQVSKYSNEKQRWGQILKRQQTKFSLQRQKYESLLEQQRNRMTIALNQIEGLKRQILQSKKYIEQIMLNQKRVEQEKDNHLVLLGTETQRLNVIVKDKNILIRNMQNQMIDLSNKLSQKSEEAESYKRQHERYRHKSILYEQEINKQNEEITRLSNNISALTSKVNQMGLLIEEKNVQLKLKDNKYSQEVQSYSQILNKSEYNFNKQLDQARSHVVNLAKQLQKTRKQFIIKEENFNQQLSWHQTQMQGLQSQKNDLNFALNRQINRLKPYQDKYLHQNKQNAKLLKESQTLRKKVEQFFIQKRTLEETYRREQKQFMQRSSKSYEQKFQQLNQRYVESNHKISELLQGKQSLQKTIYSLKNSLERSEIERQQIRKCRTFESMITQIQTLCKRTIEKQGQINELKAVIANLEKQTRQTKRQIASLHEIIGKLVNISNANQSNRREDNFLMIEEIKRLFIEHSIVIDQVKENTNKIAFNYQRHKQFLQSSQIHLVKSKEMEIEDLKERLSLNTRQSQSKDELKQIINKIITITKQNTQLKVTLNRQTAQIDQLSKQCDASRQQLTRSNDIAKLNIRDKDEICKKLLYQLQESNSLLFEEKQNQLKLQSSLIVLEEQKDKNSKEVETRVSIIKQLKNTIKGKEEYICELNQKIEQMEKRQIKQRQQLNRILESNTHLQLLNNERQQMIQQFKTRCEKVQQNLKAKDVQIEKNRKQMAQRLTQNNEQTSLQNSKLKSQLNHLLSQNSDLKQELIRIGSSILSLTETNQHLQYIESKYNSQQAQIQNYKQQTKHLLEGIQEKEIFRYQLENSKNQSEHLKRQLERHQRLMLGYSQKIQILEKELQRMESIIEDFKIQNSTLQSSNYQFSLNIQKGKIFQQKILVLSEEIDRLQRERVDFIEELNVCRLQISQDCSLDRRVQESQLLLVLLFAQVESLRSQLLKKQQQVQDLRRANLR